MKRLLATLSSLAIFLKLATTAQAAPVTNGSNGYATIDGLTNVFENVLNAAAVLSGFVVFIFLVVGAFRYITAHGDPKAVGSARMTLFWSIAGLVFIIASYIIIAFIANFTGVGRITQFCIPGPGRTC